MDPRQNQYKQIQTTNALGRGGGGGSSFKAGTKNNKRRAKITRKAHDISPHPEELSELGGEMGADWIEGLSGKVRAESWNRDSSAAFLGNPRASAPLSARTFPERLPC